jgi:hypothetical protein
MSPALERVRQRGHDAYGYVERSIERELRKTNDPYYPEFSSRCGASGADPCGTEGETDVEIDFEEMTTVVTVRSRFVGVAEAEAWHLLQLAHPPNWHDAVPTFFRASTPMEHDPNKRGRLRYAPVNHAEVPGLLDGKKPYSLLEHVEWEWTPGVFGGVYNVLGISPLSPDDVSFVNTIVDKVLKPKDKDENNEQRDKARPAEDSRRTGMGPKETKEMYAKVLGDSSSTHFSAQYEYTLERCIQSRFIASWEVGGLDVDDGTYRAVWIPTLTPDTGHFLLEVVKRVHYSIYGAVLPEIPMVLNLLAPAVVSMLMKQLGYEGIRDELNKLRSDPELREFAEAAATSARARSVDERRRAS